MPQRRIAVFTDNKDWLQFLEESFDDTPSKPEGVSSIHEACSQFRANTPEVVFADVKFLTPNLTAAFKAHRASRPDFRAFWIGRPSGGSLSHPFDGGFESLPSLADFQKEITLHLPFPNPLRLLLVDDDPGIGSVFQDYFNHRSNPAFNVETARDGIEGERKVLENPPDVLLLDIKMPHKDGREVFRDLKAKGKLPPTIVFFDIISADEVIEIRRMGNPAFVEKGARSSEMSEMAPLIKKIAYFG